jgi:predicted nucleic-acid-binding protein
VIALDTNILVRLVLHDDEAQARTAERIVVRARRERTHLFVADVVLCELVWVLNRRAGLTRAEIADTIERVLRTELIVVAESAIVETALEAYRTGRGDFADYLIRAQAEGAGASEVITFDRALKNERAFRIAGS